MDDESGDDERDALTFDKWIKKWIQIQDKSGEADGMNRACA